MKFAAFDLPRRRGPPTTASPLVAALVSVDIAAMETMQPQATDTAPLPRRHRPWLPLTGLTDHQFRKRPRAAQPLPHGAARGRPWMRRCKSECCCLLIHLHTNLTTRAPAAPFHTSQPARGPDHPPPDTGTGSRATPQTTTLLTGGSSTTPRSQCTTSRSPPSAKTTGAASTPKSSSAHTDAAPCCWPGNRNDVVVARATVADLLASQHEILGDGGYRGITTITGPRRDHTGRIVRDDHYRAHRRIRARVEHVIARIKDRQILRQCRRRGDAIDHSLQIIAGLWNLKTTSQLPGLRQSRMTGLLAWGKACRLASVRACW